MIEPKDKLEISFVKAKVLALLTTQLRKSQVDFFFVCFSKLELNVHLSTLQMYVHSLPNSKYGLKSINSYLYNQMKVNMYN